MTLLQLEMRCLLARTLPAARVTETKTVVKLGSTIEHLPQKNIFGELSISSTPMFPWPSETALRCRSTVGGYSVVCNPNQAIFHSLKAI